MITFHILKMARRALAAT